MFPLNLYARVRVLSMHSAHETAGAAHTRSSLRPLFEEGANEIEASDKKSCRENEESRVAHPSRRAQGRAPQDEVFLR